jgi:hypothetical protein
MTGRPHGVGAQDHCPGVRLQLRGCVALVVTAALYALVSWSVKQASNSKN